MDRKKSEGTTDSERYLANLCEHAFLSLWSYPNLYTDEGRKNNKGDGKELCDLLVVFNQHILIFSDKDIAFKSTGNLKTDWGRWVKKAVLRSANQVYGAEKWIREQPERIYLDRACQVPFPLQLPPSNSVHFHRIIIARNATERFREQVGGSGSLMIIPEITANEHLENPFHIGIIAQSKGYVHILDDVALDVLLYELDTIADFVQYLSAKEHLITTGSLIFAPGEEELLAFYLRNISEEGKFDLGTEEKVFISLDEGFYADLLSLPQYLNGKKADERSYFWDDLIEHLGQYALNNEWHYTNTQTMDDAIRGTKCMAAETRLARRVLSNQLLEKLASGPFTRPSVRILLSPTNPTVAYVFLIFPLLPKFSTYEEYRERRLHMLVAYCMSLKLKWPDVIEIVGVSMDSPEREAHSEEIIYCDTNRWTEKDFVDAERIRQGYNLLQNESLREYRGEAHKYPLIERKQESQAISHDAKKREQKKKQKKKRKKTQKMRKKKKK